LNKYPLLKDALYHIYKKGEYDNLKVDFIGGHTPTAYYYDSNGNEISSAVLYDMNLESLFAKLSENNFEVRAKVIVMPESPDLTTEFGGHHFALYRVAHFLKDVKPWVPTLEHNGAKGRIASLTCPQLEQHLADWLQKEGVSSGEVEFWIDITDSEEERTWRHSNGKEVAYTNWYTNEPNNVRNEDCAIGRFVVEEGNHSLKWNDVLCEEVSSAILVQFGEGEPLCEEAVPQHDKEDL